MGHSYEYEKLIISYIHDLQKEVIKQSDCIANLKNEIRHMNLSFNSQVIELCQKFNLDYSPNDA
jgi:hypothetical protein